MCIAKISMVSESGRAVPDPDSAPVRVRFPCAPPFVSDSCRYALALESREALNNDVVVVVGCAGISCPPAAFDPAVIARRAVTRRNANMSLRLPKKDVPSYEKKLANVNAGLARVATSQKRVDVLCGLIRDHFRDDHETETEVRDELSSSLGWFRDAVDLRGLGTTLFSIGFKDRRAIRDALHTTSVASMATATATSCPSSWFVPLGHGTSDEFAESFAHLVERLSNDTDEIRRHIEDAIAASPVQFFHATTRAIPFRELGSIDPAFYRNHCARTLGVDLSEASLSRVAGGHGDGANGNDVIAIRNAGVPMIEGAAVRVHGVSLRRNAASVLRDFARLRALDMLDVTSETDVATTCRSRSERGGGALVAANYDVPGDADAIEEVHVVCATQKILLGFSTGVACSRNDLRRRFLQRMGDKKSRIVDVYFRDAHLLSVDVLAHLVWRLRNRVTFGRVVLTYRFDGDLVYRGRAWDVLSHLRNRVRTVSEIPRLAETTDTVARLDRDALVECRGFCIVPTVRDVEALHAADGREHAPIGDAHDEWVYAIEPPLFGRADSSPSPTTRTQVTTGGSCGGGSAGSSLVVRYPHKKNKEWYERVPLVSPTTNAVNVRRCAKTRAGGVVVPISSLAYYRERNPWAQGEATLFAPTTLGPEWTRDAESAARGFFKRVRVVRVTDREYALDDPGRRSNAYEKLVARVVEQTIETVKN